MLIELNIETFFERHICVRFRIIIQNIVIYKNFNLKKLKLKNTEKIH